MDPAEIGREAMGFVDNLREHYGDDVQVGGVLISADVLVDGNPIACQCSDPRVWVQAAMAAETHAHLEGRNETERYGGDDE